MEHDNTTSSALPETAGRGKGWLRRLGWYVLAYVIVLVVTLPQLIPPTPKTKIGWLALIVLGPPGYLLAEWLGGKFSEPWGERTFFLKVLKTVALIGFALVAMFVWVLFAPE